MVRALVGPALSLLALSVSACATTSMEYGPIGKGQTFGYQETKQPDGSYILRVVHPVGDTAMTYWDRRAAELCGSSVYEKNIYRAIRPTLLYQNYGGMPGAAEIEGLLVCRAPAT